MTLVSEYEPMTKERLAKVVALMRTIGVDTQLYEV